MSKRKWYLFLLLFFVPFFQLSLAGVQSKQIFEAKIVDTSGVQHIIQNLQIHSKGFSLFGGGNEKGKQELPLQYGKANVVIPFENITRIEGKGRDKQTTQLVVFLKSGKKLEGSIKSNLELKGETSFSSSYTLKFLYLKSLTLSGFPEKTCSKCKRHFARKSWLYCPYDGTKLSH